MWHDFFDTAFLISLDHCKTDNFRLPTAETELRKLGIKPVIIDALRDENGAYGCFATYMALFENCIYNGYKNVLIFEDDIKLVHNDPNAVLNPAFSYLPQNYHTIHFGPNTHVPLSWGEKPLLLRMNQCRSTHAQGYSLEAMKQIVSYEWNGTPIDQLIEERLQPQGKCFCTYPLLVTQRNGYSDIDKREVNMYYIEERFENNTKHLK